MIVSVIFGLAWTGKTHNLGMTMTITITTRCSFTLIKVVKLVGHPRREKNSIPPWHQTFCSCILRLYNLCRYLHNRFTCAFIYSLSVTAHQLVLHLLDEEGLSILPQLHVQAHRLPIDLYVHLQHNRTSFLMDFFNLVCIFWICFWVKYTPKTVIRHKVHPRYLDV